MTPDMPPQSIDELVAFLHNNPMVEMTTRYSAIQASSRWQFERLHRHSLWFTKAQGTPERVGLPLYPHCQHEMGLDFGDNGFVYARGMMSIRVIYLTAELARRSQ